MLITNETITFWQLLRNTSKLDDYVYFCEKRGAYFRVEAVLGSHDEVTKKVRVNNIALQRQEVILLSNNAKVFKAPSNTPLGAAVEAYSIREANAKRFDQSDAYFMALGAFLVGGLVGSICTMIVYGANVF